MTKWTEKLRQANTIFLFLFFCGASLAVLFLAGSGIVSLFRPAGVQVIAEPTETVPNTAVEVRSAPRFVRGFYYFDIGSPRIQKGSSTEYSRKMVSDGLRAQNTINIFVVKSGEANGRLLFPKNGLVVQEHYATEDTIDGRKLTKNVFLVVRSDTNANGFLDDEDQSTVIVTDFDGTNQREVMTGLLSISVPSSNLVLIKKAEDKSTAYFELNLESGKVTELIDSSRLNINK